MPLYVSLYLFIFFFFVSKVRLKPIRGSLVESISPSLSLHGCLSLKPSLSALSQCHLTALSPNKAIKGTLNALPDFLKKKEKNLHEADTAVQLDNTKTL